MGERNKKSNKLVFLKSKNVFNGKVDEDARLEGRFRALGELGLEQRHEEVCAVVHHLLGSECHRVCLELDETKALELLLLGLGVQLALVPDNLHLL